MTYDSNLSLSNTHNLAYICDVKHRLTYINSAMLKYLQRDATGELCHEAVYQRNTPCPWCPRHTVATEGYIQTEVKQAGDDRVFRIACTTLFSEKQISPQFLIITDIILDKHLQPTVQDSETRYKRLVSSTTDYIYSVKLQDGQAVKTQHGRGCIAVTGYSAAEYEADPDLWFKMVHPEDRKKVLNQVEKLIQGEPTVFLEHRIIHKNGEICWIRNMAVTHRDHRGEVVAYDGLVTDITGRKQAEAKLNEHARQLEIINRIIVTVNKSETLSHTLKETLALSLDLLRFKSGCVYLLEPGSLAADIHCAAGCPSDFAEQSASLRLDDPEYIRLFQTGKAVFDDNCQVSAPAFFKRWGFATMARLPLMSQEKVIGVLVLANPVLHPFTEEKKEILLSTARQIGTALAKSRSETALRESEYRYRIMTEQSLVGIQIIQNNRLIFVNDGWHKITGYARKIAETWTKEDFIRMIHSSDRSFFAELLDSPLALQKDNQRVYDCRFISLAGETKWVALNFRDIHFANGSALMAIIVDITYRKAAEQNLAQANQRLKAREEELRAINRELNKINEQLKVGERQLLIANRNKEILLKEIHHRVKNNLQVVSSLLKLQMSTFKDSQTRSAMLECQARIKAMALVHETLYQAPNLAEISLSGHINNLIKHLYRAFLVENQVVNIEPEVEDTAMNIEKAILCSLLINELVSNALKHAFVKTGKGTIAVKLKTDSGNYILEVSDNGQGLPREMDFRHTSSLGMQLILTFVEQLNGTIHLDQKVPGTRFTITFPVSHSSSEAQCISSKKHKAASLSASFLLDPSPMADA